MQHLSFTTEEGHVTMMVTDEEMEQIQELVDQGMTLAQATEYLFDKKEE